MSCVCCRLGQIRQSLTPCVLTQADSYVDSYISTIGVDFVSGLGLLLESPLIYSGGLRGCFPCILAGRSTDHPFPLVLFGQKIRTIEMDGKTIKLQIVSSPFSHVTFMKKKKLCNVTYYLFTMFGYQTIYRFFYFSP